MTINIPVDPSEQLANAKEFENGFSVPLSRLTPNSNSAARLESLMTQGADGLGEVYGNAFQAVEDRLAIQKSRLSKQYPAHYNQWTAATKAKNGKVQQLTASTMRDMLAASYPTSGDPNGGNVELGTPDEFASIYPRGWPIDWRIFIMMELCEWFMVTEGDIYQALTAPMDIGLKRLNIITTNQRIKSKIQKLFDMVDLEETMEENWLITETYGNAFPITFWNPDGTPNRIININPKYVSVGRYYLGINLYELVPDKDNFQAEMVNEDAPEMFINSLAPRWNEFWTRGRGLLMDRDSIYHLHVKKPVFQRYGIPPMARVFRTISTRQVLDEMIRATIEGVRNQFWTMFVTEPRRGELDALNAAVTASVNQRTGFLIWGQSIKDGIQIAQHVPGKIDQLLANETWARLTQHIFRQLGISVRLISGEAPGFVGSPAAGGHGSTGDIDLKILIERIEWQRKQQIRWVKWFLMAASRRMGDSALESALRNGSVDFEFSDTIFQVEYNVKNKIAPLMAFGAISLHSALRMVDMDFDQELEFIEQEMDSGARDKFQPYIQYAQSAANKSGQIGKTGNMGQTNTGKPQQKTQQETEAKASTGWPENVETEGLTDTEDPNVIDPHVIKTLEQQLQDIYGTFLPSPTP